MNPHDSTSSHDPMLEAVAVYALGALPPQEGRAVRAHLEDCAQCRAEYRALAPTAAAVAYAAEACTDAKTGAIAPPSPLLKARIMRQVRPNVAEMKAVRPIVWPAYAVAAACLVFALVISIFNISLSGEARRAQGDLALMSAHDTMLARELVRQRMELADLVAPDSERFPVTGGAVVKHGSRLYIAMDTMPAPPKGKVYQAWTLRDGAKSMTPSITFVPNAGGVAVVSIPANASQLAAVAVSVEPEGGSRAPTSTPTFVVKLI